MAQETKGRVYDAVLTVSFHASNFRQLADMEDRLRQLATEADLGEEGKGFALDVKAKRGQGNSGQGPTQQTPVAPMHTGSNPPQA